MSNEAKARELRLCRSAITGKMLEAKAELSRIRALWLVDGVQTPISIRAALDRQLAELELERHNVDRELAGVEAARRAEYAASLNQHLMRIIKEEGLGRLIDAARTAAEADQAAASQDDQQQSTHAA